MSKLAMFIVVAMIVCMVLGLAFLAFLQRENKSTRVEVLKMKKLWRNK